MMNLPRIDYAVGRRPRPSRLVLGLGLSLLACDPTGVVGEEPPDPAGTTDGAAENPESPTDDGMTPTGPTAPDDDDGDPADPTGGTGGDDDLPVPGDDPPYPQAPLADPPPDCDCVADDDTCWDNLRCASTTFSCSAIEACPAGYECIDYSPWFEETPSQPQCICSDLEACGVSCDSDADCGFWSECDLNFGVCRHVSSCLEDSDCGPDEGCGDTDYWDRFQVGVAHRVCQPALAGTLAVGESCTSPSQCASGACAGVCAASCQSNSDCPASLSCGELLGGARGCVVPSATDCGSSCSNDASYCASGGAGCVEACQTQSDCDTDMRCVVDIDLPRRAYCTAGLPPCPSPDAFSFTGLSGPDAERCFSRTPCWTGADCPGDLQCRVPTDTTEDGEQSLMFAGFCAGPPAQ